MQEVGVPYPIMVKEAAQVIVQVVTVRPLHGRVLKIQKQENYIVEHHREVSTEKEKG